MTLFEFPELIVFILITLIIITGGLLTLMFLESLIECTIKAIKRRSFEITLDKTQEMEVKNV